MACWSSIDGIWSYKDLIGSKFRLKSISISYAGTINKNSPFRYSNMELTLKEVYFRVSTDGKVLILFRMEEVVGKLFIPSDLELLEIVKAGDDPKVCGRFIAETKGLVGNDDYHEKINSENILTEEIFPKSIQDNIDYSGLNDQNGLTKSSVENKEENDFLKNINNWEIVRL